MVVKFLIHILTDEILRKIKHIVVFKHFYLEANYVCNEMELFILGEAWLLQM